MGPTAGRGAKVPKEGPVRQKPSGKGMTAAGGFKGEGRPHHGRCHESGFAPNLSFLDVNVTDDAIGLDQPQAQSLRPGRAATRASPEIPASAVYFQKKSRERTERPYMGPDEASIAIDAYYRVRDKLSPRIAAHAGGHGAAIERPRRRADPRGAPV